MKPGHSTHHGRCPNGDIEVSAAPISEETDGARVHAPGLSFDALYHLHCTHLGGAGNRARREGSRDCIDGIMVLSQISLHGLLSMPEVAADPNFAFTGLYGSRYSNAPQIIADEVHNHGELSSLLGTLPELYESFGAG